MAIMQAKEEYDIASAQLSVKMQESIRNALSDKTLLRTPDQQKIVDDMHTKMIALLKENTKWEAMEPVFIDIYMQSFTQNEVNGMIDFYKTEPGQAFITKMPVARQKAMLVMQKRKAVMVQKLQQLEQDMEAQLKASQAR